MSSAKRKFVIVQLPILTVPLWSSSASAIILSTVMLKRVGESRHPWRTPNCGSEPFFNVVMVDGEPFFNVVMVDCPGRLAEAFYGSDQVVIEVIQPHGYPQSCMPNPVECLLGVHEDMVKALLVLQVFLTEYSKKKKCSVVLLPALKPACSSLMISSAGDFSLFRRILSMTLFG